MKYLTFVFFLCFVCALAPADDCPREIEAADEFAMAAVTPSLIKAVTAPAATIPKIPWLYRRIFLADKKLIDCAFWGASGALLQLQTISGLSFTYQTVITFDPPSAILLKTMLADAGAQANLPAQTSSSTHYLIEYGGMDPVSGKTFVLSQWLDQTHLWTNPASNTTNLIALINQWCM